MPVLGGGALSGRPTSSGAAGSAGERALAWRSVRRTISPGRGSDSRTSPASAIAAPSSSRRGETVRPPSSALRASRSPRRGTPSAAISQSASSGVARARTSRPARDQLRQLRRPAGHGAAAGRIVHDQHQRAGCVAGHAAQRNRRTGGGQHQRGDQQRPQQQQQPVLQLQPPLVLLGRGYQIADSRKDDGGRLTPCQQVQENRDGGRERARPAPTGAENRSCRA